MRHRIMVTQILRVEKQIVLEVDAPSVADAIEAIDSGEVDIPSAADDIANLWTVARSSLEHEDYRAV